MRPSLSNQSSRSLPVHSLPTMTGIVVEVRISLMIAMALRVRWQLHHRLAHERHRRRYPRLDMSVLRFPGGWFHPPLLLHGYKVMVDSLSTTTRSTPCLLAISLRCPRISVLHNLLFLIGPCSSRGCLNQSCFRCGRSCGGMCRCQDGTNACKSAQAQVAVETILAQLTSDRPCLLKRARYLH